MKRILSIFFTLPALLILTVMHTSNAENINIVIDSETNGNVVDGEFQEVQKQMSHGKSTMIANNHSSFNSYTFKPDLPEKGHYRVYAWWPASTKYSAATMFNIHHDVGTASIEMDQTKRGGHWVLLGQFLIGTSGSGMIDISNNGDGVIAADAIRYEYLGANTPELSIGTTALQIANSDTIYNETITARGGKQPYTWALSQPLPSGLQLNKSTGLISGMPTDAGIFKITVQAKDSNGDTVSTNLELHVIDNVTKSFQ